METDWQGTQLPPAIRTTRNQVSLVEPGGLLEPGGAVIDGEQGGSMRSSRYDDISLS